MAEPLSAERRAEIEAALRDGDGYLGLAVGLAGWRNVAGDLLAALTAAEAERDRLSEALDACDHATYGWSYSTAFTVIENVRLIARRALLTSRDQP